MRMGIDRNKLVLALLALLTATTALAGCQPIQAPANAATPATATEQERANGDRYLVSGVELLGEAIFPTGYAFADTEVGGLSAIAYDAANATYYLLSDD